MKKKEKKLSGLVNLIDKKINKFTKSVDDHVNKKVKKIDKKINSGNFFADWINNSFSSPFVPCIISGLMSAALFLIFIFQWDWVWYSTAKGWFFVIIYLLVTFIAAGIWVGIKEYGCPKCGKAFVGELLSSSHIGSREQARKFRTKERRTVRPDDYRVKSYSYEVEKDEMGTVQVDTYLNKAKCKRCSHRWEFNSKTEARVR